MCIRDSNNMRKIFIALCTMISVITGNAQNTPIGENIELAGENPEALKVIYVNKDVSTHFIAMEDIKSVSYTHLTKHSHRKRIYTPRA